MERALTAARVAIVSGKGGVGKTTVSAALALAAAAKGMRVLLAEIEDRQAFAPLFGLEEIGYRERTLAPNLSGLSVEADEALVEYLQLFYGIPKLSRALVHSKAVEFATNTAPGLRDILLIGKVKESERRRRDASFVFDLIVLDAPPTGRLPRFLDAPRAIVELVTGGPIRTQAQGVLDMVLDHRRAQVVLVTQPEEMPVRETVEAVDTLHKMGIALGPVVVNGMWAPIPGLGDDAEASLRAAADGSLGDTSMQLLARVAASHEARVRNQRTALGDLDQTHLPRIELPMLFSPAMGLDQVRSLGDLLARSGLM